MVLSRAYPERSQQAQRLNVEEYVQQRIDRAIQQEKQAIIVEQAEERRILMALSQVYIEWENQAKQRGIEQERRSVIENLMQLRFGSIDQDLRAIIPQWMNLDKTEHTRLILQLAQLSKAELIQYFKS
jgi:2-oxoglutarate dehydrogenase complex dehydrogenase (E1) component-like enzyme